MTVVYLCHVSHYITYYNIIPKYAKVSFSNIDNYRGIALFNCICKLYDNITLFLHGNYLNTSDMQFGYKKESLKNNVYIDLQRDY